MNDIDLLWQIQNHSNTLEKIRGNLKKIANENKIGFMGERLKQSEKRLKELEERIKDSENKLNTSNTILKEHDYKLKMIEKDLYEGTITDLKQLSFLDRERQVIGKEVETRELEILAQMEEVEGFKKEFAEIEENFQNLRKDYTRLVKECKALIEEFKEKAIKVEGEMNQISSKVDKNLLKKYTQIKNSRGNAVVEVIDYKCNGCNMLLSTLMVDRLKNHDEIVYCENCGRILYIKK